MNSMERAALAVATCLVVSCGGGSSTPAPDAPTLSGTVALGAPLVGASVAIKCRSGSTTVSTDAAGTYAASMSTVQFPCVLKASGGTFNGQTNAVTLFSMSVDGGTANITPLTHLLSARLFAADPLLVYGEIGVSGFAAITQGAIDAAHGAILPEVGRLGVVLPADLDLIKAKFVAQASDGEDQTIAALMRSLEYAALTLSQATTQIATGPFDVREGVSSHCKPGVIAGFAGPIADPMVAVPQAVDNGGGGTGGGDGGAAGAGGGDGAGAGGSLGQFKNTLVIVERMDGKEIGRATTDGATGMVTIVPCQYKGPVRITFVGQREDATYFDEARNQGVSFAGKSLCSVVPSITKNIGVTPLTNAACAYLNTAIGVGASSAASTAWAAADKIQAANDIVKAQANEHLASIFRVGDITRLPAIVGSDAANQLQDTPNGRYGAMLSGLVRATGEANPTVLSPALTLTETLRQDLSDGKLDNNVFGSGISAANSIYSFDSLWARLNTGAGDTANKIGVPALSQKSFLLISAGFISWRVRFFSDGSVQAGDFSGRTLPVVLPAGVRFTGLAFGEARPVGLTSDGCLRGLNDGENGRIIFCGTPSAAITSFAVASSSYIARTSDGAVGTLISSGALAVAALSAAPVAYALMDDGTVKGWFTRKISSFLQCSDFGDDRCDGRLLGSADFGYATTPTTYPGLVNIKAIFTGTTRPDFLEFLAAIDRDGRVFEAFGTPKEYRYPKPICSLDWPTYAIGCDGTVYNKDGSLAAGLPKAFRIFQGRVLGLDGSFTADGVTTPGPGDGALN